MLSIILVSWNTRKLLTSCLTSIYTYPPHCQFEVWVVDNASSDGTQEMLREIFPQVHLIENIKNLGFASANNQALSLVDSPYILLLNPDTIIKPGALNELVAYIDKNPQVGAAGARLLSQDGSLQVSCYVTPTLFREFLRLMHLDRFWPGASYQMNHWDITLPREVEIIQGACMILRKMALDQVGLFDERFFIYTEEVDLCYRLRQAGWKLHWVPQAEVIHYEGQSTSQVAPEMFIRLYQSKLMFFRKHQGKLAAWVYKVILFMISLPRVMLMPISWLKPIPKRLYFRDLGFNYIRLLVALLKL
jgi:N-acetylglucosaminyl-diphospho-decaprenol L-rhamnosyltransferase